MAMGSPMRAAMVLGVSQQGVGVGSPMRGAAAYSGGPAGLPPLGPGLGMGSGPPGQLLPR